jgi:hypothetical protein
MKTFDLDKYFGNQVSAGTMEDKKKKNIQRPSNHPNKEKNHMKPSHSRNLS